MLSQSNLLVNVEICGSEVVTMVPQDSELVRWYYRDTYDPGLIKTHMFGSNTYRLFHSSSTFCAIDKYVLQTFDGNSFKPYTAGHVEIDSSSGALLIHTDVSRIEVVYISAITISKITSHTSISNNFKVDIEICGNERVLPYTDAKMPNYTFSYLRYAGENSTVSVDTRILN